MSSYQYIRISPLTPAIGAEISGIDLNSPLTDAVFAEIHRAFLDHLVIFFRRQPITPRNQLALARRFGEVATPHPTHDVHPECAEINIFKSDPAVRPVTDQWHADTTFRPIIPLGAILRSVKLPPLGGDTLWGSMYAAYETLPEDLRARVEGLEAEHVLFSPINPANARLEQELRRGGDSIQLARLEAAKASPPVVHPIICTHPDSGRKLLFVNAIYTHRIIGLDDTEGHALLHRLFAHIMRPDHQVRLRWEENTVAIWDNRATQHYATSDYWPQERVMYRAAIEGWRPTA